MSTETVAKIRKLQEERQHPGDARPLRPSPTRNRPMSAADHVATLTHPVLRFASVGKPAGEDFALLDDCELPFDLSDLDGEVKDGRWEWNGEGEPVDFGRNSVYAIWIRDDQAEYERQEADYLAGY